MYYYLKAGFRTDALYLKTMKVADLKSKSNDHLKIRHSLLGRQIRINPLRLMVGAVKN